MIVVIWLCSLILLLLLSLLMQWYSWMWLRSTLRKMLRLGTTRTATRTSTMAMPMRRHAPVGVCGDGRHIPYPTSILRNHPLFSLGRPSITNVHHVFSKPDVRYGIHGLPIMWSVQTTSCLVFGHASNRFSKTIFCLVCPLLPCILRPQICLFSSQVVCWTLISRCEINEPDQLVNPPWSGSLGQFGVWKPWLKTSYLAVPGVYIDHFQGLIYWLWPFMLAFPTLPNNLIQNTRCNEELLLWAAHDVAMICCKFLGKALTNDWWWSSTP